MFYCNQVSLLCRVVIGTSALNRSGGIEVNTPHVIDVSGCWCLFVVYMLDIRFSIRRGGIVTIGVACFGAVDPT